MMGLASAKVSSATNSSLSSSKTSAQALQYAETQADIVRNTAYDNLSSKVKTQIAGTHFYEEVTVGAETAYKEDIKKKDCTVNIYSGSETIPRATLSITRLTKEENQASGVPVGTVLSWYGKLADIPDGFALCDGTNRTPDLRDRFVVGAGGEYAFGATGGEKEVKLEATQIGNHYHAVGSYNFGNNNGSFLGLPSKQDFLMPPNGGWIGWNGSHNGGYYSGPITTASCQQITSLAVATAAQKPHENRPPYYALYYIMKL